MVYRAFSRSRSILAIFSVLFMLTISILILVPEEDQFVSGLDSVSPISISGNSQLSSHSQLDSGTGTNGDPYVFSDMSIDCTSSGSTAISVVGTNKYVVFKNITIYAHSSNPAIYLNSVYSGSSYRAMYVTLKNITVIGGGTHLYMNLPIQIIVTDCNFTNPAGSGKIIHTYYGYYNTFSNNFIDAPNMDVDLEFTSYTDIRQNTMSFRYLTMDRFRVCMVENNTFDVISMDFFSGYFSVVQMNDFVGRSASYDIARFHDCNRIYIANNSFKGGNDAIMIQHPNAYSPVYDVYHYYSSFTIQYNTFSDTYLRGIYFYYATGHPVIAYMQIHHNEFTSCGTYGIEVYSGGSPTSMIYRNSFIDNNGAGEVYTSSNAQCRDRWSQFTWYEQTNDIGNYWSDWEIGDDDDDGFIDGGNYPLSSSNGQMDPYPVSNRYFDFSPPEIQITSPVSTTLENRYLNITWDAQDPETSIMVVQVRKGATLWTNVTGRNHHGLYLSSGLSYVQVRAVNNGGLRTLLDLNYLVDIPNEPVVLQTPRNGEYYSRKDLEVTWNKVDEFIPRNLTTSLDRGLWQNRDIASSHILDLDDGQHNYRMNFTDFYDNKILKTIEFTIDTILPSIEMQYPRDGSVISNQIVDFMWTSHDNIGIRSVSMQIDGGESFKVEGGEGSYGLDQGTHNVILHVQDLAGNNASTSTSFTIGRNTSLHITGPLLLKPTRERTHTVTWEYLSSFDIAALSIIIDGEQPLTLPQDSTSYNLNIGDEGVHSIMVRASDPAGNVYSDTIEVHLDLTSPVTGFLSPLDGDHLNRTDVTIRWSSLEEGGLKGYDLILDGILIADDTLHTEMNIFLEEGPHVLELKATDLAGNQDSTQMTITVDITLPEVRIVSPPDGVSTDPYLDLRWEASDNIGIERFNYSIDGKPFLELGKQTSRSVKVTEGYHTVVLNTKDLAGNIRTITKEILVDLNPPEVSLFGPEGDFIKEWRGLINWNITEEIGVAVQVLTVDGVQYSLATDSRYYITDLQEGHHEISLFVIDLGGWNSSTDISFTIDSSVPIIEKGVPDIEITGNKANLFWSVDPSEGPMDMLVFFDDDEINTSAEADSLSLILAEISPGDHVVELHFTDRAGNVKVLTYEFNIEEKKKNNAEEDGGSWIWIILAIIAIVIIAVIIFLVIRKKPKEEEKVDLKKITGKVDKITIAPMPSPKHGHHRPTHPPAPTPAAISRPSHNIQSGKVDGGYIRPEKKQKKEKKTIQNIEPRKESSMRKPEPQPEKDTPKVKKEETIEEWGEVEDWDEMEEMEDIEEFEEMEEF